MNEKILLTLAGIGLLILASQWLAWRAKLPAILFLLLTGIVVGPVTGLLQPDQLFGPLLLPIVSLSVAVILFEGSLTLKFREIKGVQSVVWRLVSVGILVTWVITALVTHYALGFSWALAWLFGAITVVTGPTVIVPMLRTVRPNARIANILRWEGIVIDPVGAILAVLVLEYLLSSAGNGALAHVGLSLGELILIGSLSGLAGAEFLGLILRRRWLPEYLHNTAALALVLGVFSGSNLLQEESGLLAVTVMGLRLANMPKVNMEGILSFKEHLSLLLISGLFILLAARIQFDQLAKLGWGALWVFLAMQFLARPAKVWICTLGSDLKREERALLAWIAPRGIVAAAVSALFALRLEGAGFENADLLVPLTFMVIIGTVVLQSATAGPLARRLGVAEPEPMGFLVIGANPFSRELAKSLKQHGFRVRLTDTSWNNVKTARMEGLPTFYGLATSEHADRTLDLVGIGRMLGLSNSDDLNALAALRFRSEFGPDAIYTLRHKRIEDPDKQGVHADEAAMLFGEKATYGELAGRLARGAQIRDTLLTDAFGLEDYRATHGERALPLFAIDPKGRLRFYTSQSTPQPEAGWTLVALVSPDPDAAPATGPDVERQMGK
ncbi:MAG: sodium:proton antiporter [Chromatiales bacterium]|nr:sodium:proton antiporter [Chromatiales bacterium]